LHHRRRADRKAGLELVDGGQILPESLAALEP